MAAQNRSRRYRHGSSLLRLRLLHLPALLFRPKQHACPRTAPARPHSGTALECQSVWFRAFRCSVSVWTWVESLDRNPGKWFSVCVCPDELGSGLWTLRLFLTKEPSPELWAKWETLLGVFQGGSIVVFSIESLLREERERFCELRHGAFMASMFASSDEVQEDDPSGGNHKSTNPVFRIGRLDLLPEISTS